MNKEKTDIDRLENLFNSRFKLLQLSYTSTMADLLQKTIEEAELLTESTIGFYHFLDSDQKTITLQAWSSNTVKKQCKASGSGAHYHISEAGVWVDCVKERKPVIHNDYSALPHKKGMPEGHAKVDRELVVPVFRKDKIVAILGVGNKPELYNEGDIKVVSQLADLAWDLVELKRAEERMKIQEKSFETVFSTSPDAISITEIDGTYLSVNKSYTTLTGYKTDDVIGKINTEIGLWQNPSLRANLIDEIREHGEARNHEIKMQRKDGRIIYGLLSAAFIEVEGRNCVLTITKDISALKEAEQTLIREKQKAEESDRLKTVFLRNMSHELRTPMNGILGFSKLFMKPDLDFDKRKEYAEIVMKSGNQLMGLINDILDISRIETGKIVPKYEYVNVCEVMKDLQLFFELETKKKKLELLLENELENEICYIKSDKVRLAQIISNLIGNSLKYTTGGFIKFGCKQVIKEEKPMLQFFVEDTGTGISMENQEAIFQPFHQENTDLNKSLGGTGLGLAIAKNLVAMLGGDIWLKSEPGRGSTFFFTIPALKLNTMTDSDKNSTIKRESDYIHVLVAEDEEMNMKFIRELLIDENVNLIHAKNGYEAVELCQKNLQIKLVLMDMKMPGMDGFEATEKIKKLFPSLPVIAQSAYAMAEDKLKAERAGCTGFMTKPIDGDELVRIINKYRG